MSKKNKRKLRKISISIAPAQQPGMSGFNPDYTHIKRDLRRIGVLAVTFFAILVALSFFLR